MDFADDDILIRGIDPAHQAFISEALSLIEQCVNFGTHLLKKCYAMEHFASITPALLGRQVLVCLDGIGQLLQAGCFGACKPLLRSEMECALMLRYMQLSETLRRARQYEFFSRKREIRLLKQVDPGTPEGQQLKRDLEQQGAQRVLNRVAGDKSAVVAEMEASLLKPHYEQVRREWDRFVADKRRPPRHWYALFDGPEKLDDLAKAVGKYPLYWTVYKQFSSYIHGEEVRKPLRGEQGIYTVDKMREDDTPTILPVLGLNLASECYLTLYDIYGLDKRELADWYRQSFQERFVRLWQSHA